MFSRLREPFGKAGLIMAIIALVTALVGGAYAASTSRNHKKAAAGLNSKQKTEVKKIAQSFQGSGPAGPQGPAGAKGDAGSNGSNGSSGSNGTSVTSKSLPIGNGHCTAGGSEFVAASGTTYACNGEEGAEGPQGPQGDPGEPGVVHPGETLPPEASETGTWAIGRLATAGVVYMPISFPIPLSSEVAVNFVPEGSSPTASCPGGPEEPQAAPGNLCVYETIGSFGITFEEELDPETGVTFESAGKTGAVLIISNAASAKGYGTWAVTAPEA